MKVNNTCIDEQCKLKKIGTDIGKNKFIYALLAPAVILVFIFSYMPMSGILMAFQDYNIFNPAKSEWIGLANFKELFADEQMIGALFNTLYISLLNLIIAFPMGVIFALLLNELKNGIFKRTVQSISYLPHFLSWVSVIGMVTSIYALEGPLNDLLVTLGAPERRIFLAEQSLFVPNIVFLGVWKELGWSSIVYLAAISGVDQSLYEAAIVDGAGKFRQAISVTLPSILPTVVIMLIWRVGSLLSDNFELIYGMQNSFIDFEVIQTVIYKQGIEGGNYQMTTAFGLSQGIVNMIMLLLANEFAKRATETSLF